MNCRTSINESRANLVIVGHISEIISHAKYVSDWDFSIKLSDKIVNEDLID